MKEYAANTFRSDGAMARIQQVRARFSPLSKLGYSISGCDDRGFTAVDKSTGKTIRRLTFDAFDKAVRKAGLTPAARSQLLEKRASPDGRLRDQVENQRLQLLAMERREVCPSKRKPKPKPVRTAAPVRRLRMNNFNNVAAGGR